MIKNIIFDIGNVIATFQARETLSHFFQSKQDISCIFDLYFSSDLWNQYDKGTYTKEELIEMGCQKYPNLSNSIQQFMTHWQEYVIPIPSTLELIDSLHKQGFKTYILSNIPIDSYTYLLEHYQFIQKMDGGIFSYQDKVIKPSFEVYQLLLERYSLQANECLFIDDRKENTEAAAQLGFHTIHCVDATQLPSLMEDYL